MWQRPTCTIKKKLCILPNIVKYVLNATYVGTRNENYKNLHEGPPDGIQVSGIALSLLLHIVWPNYTLGSEPLSLQHIIPVHEREDILLKMVVLPNITVGGKCERIV